MRYDTQAHQVSVLTVNAANAFLSVLNSSGTETFFTYFGGSTVDVAGALDLDSANHAYIAGLSASTDMETTNTGYQLQMNATSKTGKTNAFLAELDPTSADCNTTFATPTATATAAATATPTATPTSTPVAGKLKVTPKVLNFGVVLTGGSRTHLVTIRNAGKHTKKMQAPAITLESETTTSQSPFAVTANDCPPMLDAGAHCTVSITFTPGMAIPAGTKMPFTATLTVDDNVIGDLENMVTLKGTGKAPK